MPKKRNKNTLLLGKVALFHQLRQQIAELQEQEKELKADLVKMIKDNVPASEDGTYRYSEEGYELEYQIQKREYFNQAAAMEILNQLPEEEYEKYITVSTDKNQIHSAFLQDAISEEDVRRCFTEKPVEVVRLKKES